MTPENTIEVRARKFADAINLFMLNECKIHKYSAQELFAAIVLLKELCKMAIKKDMGAEALKKLEQSIQVVDYNKLEEC